MLRVRVDPHHARQAQALGLVEDQGEGWAQPLAHLLLVLLNDIRIPMTNQQCFRVFDESNCAQKISFYTFCLSMSFISFVYLHA